MSGRLSCARIEMNFEYGAFGLIFIIVFVLVIVIFIAAAVRGVSDWNKNNHSPQLTVTAKVVSKRTSISHHRHANAGDISGARGFSTTRSTRYYVTFQVDNGDKMEFSVTGSEYGMLDEGDTGKLSFQGTRYLSFEKMATAIHWL